MFQSVESRSSSFCMFAMCNPCQNRRHICKQTLELRARCMTPAQSIICLLCSVHVSIVRKFRYQSAESDRPAAPSGPAGPLQECRSLTRHGSEPLAMFKHNTKDRCSSATRPNHAWLTRPNRHDMADTALKADTTDMVGATLEQSTPEPPRSYRFRITQLPR